MQITFVTSNKVKFDTARKVLKKYGVSLAWRRMELREIQEIDLRKVALYKAEQAKREIRNSFMVDDSGICLDALGGFPGALFKPVIDTIGSERFAQLLHGKPDKSASFFNVLVFHSPSSKGFKIFTTNVRGHIAYRASKKRRTGWRIDNLFVPEGHRKKISDMGDAEFVEFIKELEGQLHYTKLGKWLAAK
ncbi:MAG: hypothetical protein KGH61_00370 [Candidatus Micrarchaeota archaeon]|nr:hypothetical protein [Candidatus Micrarchaeota archaeon]MDE1847391.1 hypothetical protein [Candidatus Micrarchaeota archaeon]MDE1864006.1 hypothetical protein [Candidatus Micrarchaeota archaeon]